MIAVKRIYDQPAETDGFRVLTDRLWPRGMTREAARIDLWLRDIAPSPALRKWFSHDAEKWEAFKGKYREELADKAGLLEKIRELDREHGKVTLLFAARDTQHNQAVALLEFLLG